MNALIPDEVRTVINSIHYRPAISIIMPFDVKINLKTEITHAMKMAANKVMEELNQQYPSDITAVIMQKLNAIFNHLDFDTGKKSVAIYLSPVFEKVFYMDIPVEEKIIIDESFEIRDLVYSIKQQDKLLLLCLTSKDCWISIYDSKDFIMLMQSQPESDYAFINEPPERIANFSDVSKRKEIVMERSLKHIDKSLDDILKTHHLPVVILGDKRMVGHYKKSTSNPDAIMGYIHGNYAKATPEQLKEILDPWVANWKKTKEKDLLNQLEAAADNKKLVTGIREVWHEVMNNNARLLVVEKNYMYAAQHVSEPDIIYKRGELNNTFSAINDAVDDAIKKVLQSGGDIGFVQDGSLHHYQQIALIKYY